MTPESEKSPAQIESEIVRTRSEMGRTLNALQNRLSPGQLLDGALGQLGAGSGQFAASLGRTVRANPVPTTLVGLGLGWLMIAGSGTGSRDAAGREPAPVADRRLSSSPATSGAARPDRPARGSGEADDDEGSGGRMQGVVDDLRDRAGGVRRRAGAAAAESRRRVASARQRVGRFVDEQPLLLGAVGVAIGAVLAAALPATRRENTLFGETRDRLKDKALESGSRRMEDVEKVVGAAVRTAKDEASQRGLVPPGKPDDKGSRQPGAARGEKTRSEGSSA